MRRRGLTLVELLVGLILFTGVFVATANLLVDALRVRQRQDTQVTQTVETGQATRRIAEALRDAATMAITNNGATITYQFPRLSTGVDGVTGEREILMPVQGDGTARSFSVTNGSLVDERGDVLARDVLGIDPDPNSSQYNQAYQVFQATTVGSRRAVTINLILGRRLNTTMRYTRTKTTVVVRNAR